MTEPGHATTLAAAAVVGYLLGSVPWGLVLLKVAGGPDPRKVGSGNIGATNVARAGGRALGLATLVLDAGKAAAAGLLFAAASHDAAVVAATFALLGHCFSPWLRLRGGKGVATLLGATAVAAFPWAMAAFALAWLVVALGARYASVASLAAAWSAGLAACLSGSVAPDGLALAACAAVVTWRHRENLVRLARGEEPRIFARGAAARTGGRR